MKILIIEDDQDISNFLKNCLEAEFFTVDQAFDGHRGSYLARTNNYDLIIVDYMLPLQKGDEVVKETRADGKNTPIIMLTVNTDLDNKINLFEIGVDDYLTKPFVFEELLARIRALLRRPINITTNIIKIDDLIIDLEKHRAWRGKREVYLTRREFSLLEYMAKNQGRVLSRSAILDHVWDMDVDVFSNTVESHILKLRKKINGAKRRDLIHNVSGCGYKIDIKR